VYRIRSPSNRLPIDGQRGTGQERQR
jgi:hypothetical protein